MLLQLGFKLCNFFLQFSTVFCRQGYFLEREVFCVSCNGEVYLVLVFADDFQSIVLGPGRVESLPGASIEPDAETLDGLAVKTAPRPDLAEIPAEFGNSGLQRFAELV